MSTVVATRLSGTTIVPLPTELAAGYVLQRNNQEKFYLGFNEPSLALHNVTSFDSKSRAATEGGVKAGDHIILGYSSFMWSAET